MFWTVNIFLFALVRSSTFWLLSIIYFIWALDLLGSSREDEYMSTRYAYWYFILSIAAVSPYEIFAGLSVLYSLLTVCDPLYLGITDLSKL